MTDSLPPEQVVLICTLCQKEFVGRPDDDCCAECFDNWDGMTIEELSGE